MSIPASNSGQGMHMPEANRHPKFPNYKHIKIPVALDPPELRFSTPPSLSDKKIKICEPTECPKINQLGSLLTQDRDVLTSLLSAPGYLVVKDNHLTATTDILIAKNKFSETKKWIDNLGKSIPRPLVERLMGRLMDEKLKISTQLMPASSLVDLLKEHQKKYGLAAALELLEQIEGEKIEEGKRYAAVDPWPEERHTRFLHVIPNLVKPVSAPNPVTKMSRDEVSVGSVILTMLEPSLDGTTEIDGKLYSNTELLVLSPSSLEILIENLSSDKQQEIREIKSKLDVYYRHNVSFPFTFRSLSGHRTTLVMTPPTSRYTPYQYLALCPTDRKSALELMEGQKSQLSRFVQSTDVNKAARRHSIASYAPQPLTPDDSQEIANAIESSVETDAISPNYSNIEAIANLIGNLPEDSLVAQNAFDASTDALYQHLQVFTHVPTHLVPCFVAPEEQKFTTQLLTENGCEAQLIFSRIRPETFPGTIYKIKSSTNGPEIIRYLKTLQDRFLAAESNGSSLNLVARKTQEGFEYYFVLRKSVSVHPHLQADAQKKGMTRPGWAEMIGIRIGKNQEFFDQFPDDSYADFMQTFAVEQKECRTFEDIARAEMRKVGPVSINLIENSLRSLRSDSETSQIYHIVKLSGSTHPDDSLRFIMNAPEDMQPNIFISHTEPQSFEAVAEEIAAKMMYRQTLNKNYGLIALDERLTASLPEIRKMETEIEAIKTDYLKLPGNERTSFKSFLIQQFQDDPAISNFLQRLSDRDVALFLETPVPYSSISIHQALMKQVLSIYQSSDLSKSDYPNVRAGEYAYGMTTLIHSPDSVDLDRVRERQDQALSAGGNKFNTPPSREVKDKLLEIGVSHRFIALMSKYFFTRSKNYQQSVEQAVKEAAGLFVEFYQPRNSRDVKKVSAIVEGWIRELQQHPHLDFPIPKNFKELVQIELMNGLSEKMIPVYKNQAESYSLQQLSLDTNQIPPPFQHQGRILPCSFRKSFDLQLTTTSAEAVPAGDSTMPTGKKIAVVMNGGQAPGVADVLMGALLVGGPENEVSVFTHGNEGLINGDSVVATIQDLDLIRSQGGFPGGTTRLPLLTAEDKTKVQKNIQKFDAVIFIGGDGSYKNNRDVFVNSDVPVYFCIKTIDGDFQVEDTDFTLGFYTAIEGYGEMIETRFTQAKARNEIHFLQVGGRQAGFLAVGTSAILPEESRPTLALYPEEVREKKWSLNHIVNTLAKIMAHRIATHKPYGLFSIAEGLIQELPEVRQLIEAINVLKAERPGVKDEALKDFLIEKFRDVPASDSQIAIRDLIDAFSDEDIQLLAKPDGIGRVPFAQIDSYAALSHLVINRLKDMKQHPADYFEIVEGEASLDETVFEGLKLPITSQALSQFISAAIPETRGAKSNYDQRSRPAVKQDYSNGLAQGMAAGSAALRGLKIEGTAAAIIGTSTRANNVVAISTMAEAKGEYIPSDHPFVSLRKTHLVKDLNR